VDLASHADGSARGWLLLPVPRCAKKPPRLSFDEEARWASFVNAYEGSQQWLSAPGQTVAVMRCQRQGRPGRGGNSPRRLART